MRTVRLFLFLLAIGLASRAGAQTIEEQARKVTVTMNLNDVPPAAAAQFVQAVSKIKVHFQGRPGDLTLLSVSFENTTVDEALRYLAALAKLELTYQPDGAHLAPRHSH